MVNNQETKKNVKYYIEHDANILMYNRHMLERKKACIHLSRFLRVCLKE